MGLNFNKGHTLSFNEARAGNANLSFSVRLRALLSQHSQAFACLHSSGDCTHANADTELAASEAGEKPCGYRPAEWGGSPASSETGISCLCYRSNILCHFIYIKIVYHNMPTFATVFITYRPGRTALLKNMMTIFFLHRIF